MDVEAYKIDEVYNKIICEDGIHRELSDYFTFTVPNAKFKIRKWNGDIKLYKVRSKTLYRGLSHYLKLFCEERGYSYSIEEDDEEKIDLKKVKTFIEKLELPIKIRDYQISGLLHAIRFKRALFLSATGSGKSLIIYLLVRYFASKTLIIVPRVDLIHQLANHFQGYGLNSEKFIHKIYSEQEKHSKKPIQVSTYQSLVNMPKEWFQQFQMVIVDEAHIGESKSVTTVLNNMSKTVYRFGLTGTIKDAECHKLILEGLMGPVKTLSKARNLIDRGHLSKLKINCIILKHPRMPRFNYNDEMDYLCGSKLRNEYIIRLAKSLKKNTLILFHYIEKHGEILYNMLKEQIKDRPVYYIHGKIDKDERQEIFRLLKTHDNAIVLASDGTTSVGIDAPNLQNLIQASPSKAKIKTVQSIGRVLRNHEDKIIANIYDIADDLQCGMQRNITLDHFIERIKIYNGEQYEYKIYPVELK